MTQANAEFQPYWIRHPNPDVMARPHYKTERDLRSNKLFNEALTVLHDEHPEAHAFLLSHLGIVMTSKIPTAGVDGFFLYFNYVFFKSLGTPQKRCALLLHEILHCMYMHPQRMKAFQERGIGPGGLPFGPMQYNIAGDAVINDELYALGHDLSDYGWVHYPGKYTRDDHVDAVYVDMYQNQPKPPEPEAGEGEGDGEGTEEGEDQDQDTSQQGDDSGSEDQADDNSTPDEEGSPQQGEGSGSGHEPDDSETDTDSAGDGVTEGDDTEPFESEASGLTHGGHDVHLTPLYDDLELDKAGLTADEAMQRDTQQVQHAVDTACDIAQHRRDMGDLSSAALSQNLERCGRRKATRTDFDWRTLILNRMMKSGKGGPNDWNRVNRRRYRQSGCIYPKRKAKTDLIVLQVDTSYSVNAARCTQFLRVAAHAIDQIKPQRVIVLFVGTDVRKAVECKTGQDVLDLPIPWGGGTHMTAGVNWLAQRSYRPDCHLIFTDGEMWDDDWQGVSDAGSILVIDHDIKADLHLSRALRLHPRLKIISAVEHGEHHI